MLSIPLTLYGKLKFLALRLGLLKLSSRQFKAHFQYYTDISKNKSAGLLTATGKKVKLTDL